MESDAASSRTKAMRVKMLVSIPKFSAQRRRRFGWKRLALGVAALARPHEVDRAVVPLDLLAVERADRGHPADVGAGLGGDLGQVAGGLDLQAEQRVLDLGVVDPRGLLVVLGHHGAQRLHREDRALAAEDGHVAAAEHVLHVEGGELGALAGDEEPGDRALDLGVVDAVDGGDAADAGVGDDLGLQLLDRVGRQRGVPVDAEQVVGVADEGEAVVQGADLLVGVLRRCRGRRPRCAACCRPCPCAWSCAGRRTWRPSRRCRPWCC